MGSPDEPGTDIREAPLFLPGERYLLFLREADNSPGLFGGFGPWGRYLVWENQVYSMNHILLPGAYQAPLGLNFDGAALNSHAKPPEIEIVTVAETGKESARAMKSPQE